MQNLRTIPMFSKLCDEDIEKLKEISTIRKYNVKEILFYEGEEPLYMHILLSGTLRLYKTNYRGNQIFLHDFKPINLVAELANFENIPYPATAEFSSSGEVMKIDYKKLEENFFKNHGIIKIDEKQNLTILEYEELEKLFVWHESMKKEFIWFTINNLAL